VPSTTLMILGFQIMFSSFLLSILQLEANRASPAVTPRMLSSLEPSTEPGVR
jgi:hypothetical protein